MRCRSLVPYLKLPKRCLSTQGQGKELTSARYPDLERGNFAKLSTSDVQEFERLLGAENVLTQELDAYNEDWLGIYRGASQCVLRPKCTNQMSVIMRHCHERELAVCPQGGNTGLVGGSVPLFDEIVISTQRINSDFVFDPYTGIVQCDAGFILEELDVKLNDYGFMMPIDLGAKGSCHIGGNVATAAGGIRLIRYGSLHAHVLALDVVLSDGTVLSCGSALRKDNTGLHLPHLFVGSEGVLGIITKVTMTAVPKPQAINLAFFAVDSFSDCLELLNTSRRNLAEILSSFELVDAATMQCVVDNLHLSNPLSHTDAPFYVLVETSGSNEQHDSDKMNAFMEMVIDKGLANDGVLAQNEQQRQNIWKLRESGAEALRLDGYTYKQDFSLPHEHYYAIAPATRDRLGDLATRVVLYGHLADGNAHLNITSPQFDPRIQEKLYPWLYEWVKQRGGSISAEHGLGFAKRNYAHYSQNRKSLELMAQLKAMFDPKRILNPYKVI